MTDTPPWEDDAPPLALTEAHLPALASAIHAEGYRIMVDTETGEVKLERGGADGEDLHATAGRLAKELATGEFAEISNGGVAIDWTAYDENLRREVHQVLADRPEHKEFRARLQTQRPISR
jgi:hypothetical protein